MKNNTNIYYFIYAPYASCDEKYVPLHKCERIQKSQIKNFVKYWNIGSYMRWPVHDIDEFLDAVYQIKNSIKTQGLKCQRKNILIITGHGTPNGTFLLADDNSPVTLNEIIEDLNEYLQINEGNRFRVILAMCYSHLINPEYTDPNRKLYTSGLFMFKSFLPLCTLILLYCSWGMFSLSSGYVALSLSSSSAVLNSSRVLTCFCILIDKIVQLNQAFVFLSAIHLFDIHKYTHNGAHLNKLFFLTVVLTITNSGTNFYSVSLPLTNSAPS